MKTSVDKLVNSLLATLLPRQKEVLEGRYGLKNGREMTLAALGVRYKITRERIRQIQNLSLEELRSKAKESGLAEFGQLLKSHLATLGGVRKDDALIADVAHLVVDKGERNTFKNRVAFLMETAQVAKFRSADREFNSLWYADEASFNKAGSFIGSLVKNLSLNKEVILAEKKFDQYLTQTAQVNNLPDLMVANFMTVSKRFITSQYGDMGLAAWPEINPRTSRDYAYLVLKKENKPLHFTAIADGINKVRKNKKTNFQTVHNELIKDERFVLVGRGTYGLVSFGLMAGTAKEVMSAFLKKHGPLKAKDIIQLVLEKRTFKENTLLLNLQSKKHFKRLEDGRYSLLEA